MCKMGIRTSLPLWDGGVGCEGAWWEGGLRGREYTYAYSDSCCCRAETNPALWSNYTPKKKIILKSIKKNITSVNRVRLSTKWDNSGQGVSIMLTYSEGSIVAINFYYHQASCSGLFSTQVRLLWELRNFLEKPAFLWSSELFYVDTAAPFFYEGWMGLHFYLEPVQGLFWPMRSERWKTSELEAKSCVLPQCFVLAGSLKSVPGSG